MRLVSLLIFLCGICGCARRSGYLYFPKGETIRCSYAGERYLPYSVEVRSEGMHREIRVIQGVEPAVTNRVILSGSLLVKEGDATPPPLRYFTGAVAEAGVEYAVSRMVPSNGVSLFLLTYVWKNLQPPVTAQCLIITEYNDHKRDTWFFLSTVPGGDGSISRVGTDLDIDGYSSWLNKALSKGEKKILGKECDFQDGIRKLPSGRWDSYFFRKGDKTIEIIPDNKERRE